MSNQPQPRPWFRLATLARAQAQAPAQPQPTQTQTQTQPPAAPLARAPTFRPAFRPTAPAPQPPPPRAAVPPPSATRAPTPPPPASVPPPRSPPASSAPPPPPPQSSAPRVAVPSPSAASPPPRSPPGSPAPSQPQPQSPVPRARAAVPPSSAVSPPPRSPSASPAPPPSKATSPLATSSSPSKTPQKSPSPPPRPSPAPSPTLPKASPVVTKPREPSPSGKVGEAPSLMPGAFMIDKRALPTKGSNGSPEARVFTPRVLSTPPESPKKRSTVSPPSPFALPPSQLKSDGGEREFKNNIPPEAEKKTVLVQETLPKPKPFSESPMYAKPKGRENFHWKSSDEEEGGMRVITIAGENRGAIMELGYSPVRRTIKSDNEAELSGNEARSKMEEAKAKPALPMNAFMNSNVQGVNSSILFNSSCSHHDPGVHFSLSRKPFNNGGHAHGVHHSNGKNISQKEKANGKWFST